MGLIEIKPEFSERESRAIQNVNNAYLAQRIAIGTILAFAGDTIPDGTLLCDGQAVSRTEYAELFEKIGTTYGAGNGSTTFNVPNLKGRVPVGYDASQSEFNTLGKTGGEKTHTLTIAEMPSHNHATSSLNRNFLTIETVANLTGERVASGSDYYVPGDADTDFLANEDPTTASAGEDQAHNNLQPYVTINYIIIARPEVTHGDIESALADLIVETQDARDSANTAAGEVRSEMAGIKAVDGIVKGDGAGNFSAADAGDMPITDEDEHFTAGTVEGALAEAGEHIADTDNPHGVTAAQIGLGDVDNTADADKPVSTAQAVAIAGALDEAKSYTDSVAEDKADKSTTYTKDEIDDALLEKADKSALTETNLRIATINKSLSDYQNAIASINVNQSPKQTATGYGTVSLPVNAANGQVSVSVKGLTATNLIKNGDFSDGTTKWTVQNANISIINGKLNYAPTGRISRLFNPSAIVANHIYYYKHEGFSSNNPTGIVSLGLTSGISASTVVEILMATDYYSEFEGTKSFVFAPTQDADGLRYNFIIDNYDDNVLNFNSVLFIDITETFGAGNEPTKEECDKIFANWFDGTKSTVSAGRLVSESADETERTEMYIPDVGLLRSGGLFNLADNGEDYENWIVDVGISKSAEGLSASIYGYAELPANFKPSTVYTLVYNASIPAGCYIAVQDNLLEVPANLQNGFHKFKITTKSSITDSNLRLLLLGRAGSTVTFALYGVYEGDQTSNPDVDEPRPYGGSSEYDEIAYNKQSGQYEKIQRIDDEGEPLPEPVISPISVTGTLVGHPNGTVRFEPVLPVAGVYTASGIEVTDTDYAIDTLERIAKIDFMTGVETEVDVSQAVIAGDGLSFTHADLIDGDIVFFTYYHDVEGTQPEITAEYYDSRYTVKDSETEQFYRWKVSVANGVPSLEIEVV